MARFSGSGEDPPPLEGMSALADGGVYNVDHSINRGGFAQKQKPRGFILYNFIFALKPITMTTNRAFNKLDFLIESSPSVLVIGGMVLPLRILSSILWPILFFGGLGAAIICTWLLDNEKATLEHSELAAGVVIGLSAFVLGVLFWIISRLCKLVRNRNYFILEVVALVEDIKEEERNKTN